uniref:Slc18a-7 n=1 Tax=Schmidtea mediterranea TaxID=79327 RepID=A0A0H3YFC2_SCHMD|nr:slc18a-7 [Schmidtea mediterranea]
MYNLIDENGERQTDNCFQKIGRKFFDFNFKVKQRTLVLMIVFVALLLDNVLLTVIVPIMPEYLWTINHNEKIKLFCPGEKVTNKDWTSMIGRKHFGSEILTSTRENDSISCIEELKSNSLSNISSESIAIGLMFASKPVVQLIVNPLVGPITNRMGYTVPMFTGFVVLFISTIVFAFAESYKLLFFARSFQGIGSACSSVSGMGMLATFYPDDKERGEAFGFALSGLAMGVLIGPSFGGIMYEYTDKQVPFIILGALVFLDGVLQMIVLKPSIKPEPQLGASLKSLLMDPYIVLAAACITIGNMGIAVLEPSLPIWIKSTMKASRLEQGLVFLPFSLSYLLGTNVFGYIGHKIGRWLGTMIGMLLISIFLLIIPLAVDIGSLIVPGTIIGFAIGMVDSSILPIMGYLVDIRHVSVYGTVYAIADVAFCVGFATGPAISGAIIKAIGFQWMLTVAAIVCFLFTPLIVFLRNPPAKVHDSATFIKEQCPVDYQKNKIIDNSNLANNIYRDVYDYQYDYN